MSQRFGAAAGRMPVYTRRRPTIVLPQGSQEQAMEFGILFTSQPHTEHEPYPHRDVHRRVTDEIMAADRLGFDCAWLAEHHFSTEYGIMPDVWVYAGYLAALTKRIKLGMAVVTLPLANPVRTVENAGFVDILSGGRVVLGVGSGYRKYEFDGFGLDFEARRDMQEEALEIVLDLLRTGRSARNGKHFSVDISGAYQLLPHALQRPYPPLFLAGATDRSIATAGRLGFGLMLSTLTPFANLVKQVAHYRANLETASQEARANPAFGHVDVARWVYVAETDTKAKRDSEEGLLRHLKHFFGGQQAGYLGQVSQGKGSVASGLDYDTLARSTIIHGSPTSVAARIAELREKTGLTSLMLHYPPWYGTERAKASLQLFAQEVMPRLRPPARAAE
jgi:alkanesulfonate monooxygenase SsuD/methylene tetrahydromethanopterin reductase-like flavin-dependent oxidoreductase (luciferase family)